MIDQTFTRLSRPNRATGRKEYGASINGKVLRRTFRRATDRTGYVEKVQARYQRMRDRALALSK